MPWTGFRERSSQGEADGSLPFLDPYLGSGRLDGPFPTTSKPIYVHCSYEKNGQKTIGQRCEDPWIYGVGHVLGPGVDLPGLQERRTSLLLARFDSGPALCDRGRLLGFSCGAYRYGRPIREKNKRLVLGRGRVFLPLVGQLGIVKSQYGFLPFQPMGGKGPL